MLKGENLQMGVSEGGGEAKRHMTLHEAYDLGCDWYLAHDFDAPFPRAECDRLKETFGESVATEFRRGWNEAKGRSLQECLDVVPILLA